MENKQLSIKDLMENEETGFPYDGAKEYYIMNVDNSEDLSKGLTEVFHLFYSSELHRINKQLFYATE
jgi:hypothetical protein